MIRVSRPFWLIVHYANTIAHFGVILAGFATFAASGMASVSKPGSDRMLVIWPWVSSAVGGLGTAFNSGLVRQLRKTMETNAGTEQDRYFKKQLVFGGALLFSTLSSIADLAVAGALENNARMSTLARALQALLRICAAITLVMAVLDLAVFFEERRDYIDVTKPSEPEESLEAYHD